MPGEAAPGMAAWHELEDGVISRQTQVTLRDRRVFVEYSLGLNDRTLSDTYQALTDKPAAEDLPTRVEQFKEVLLDQLTPGIVVSVDGLRLEPLEKLAERGSQHHERFIVRLQYDVPESTADGVLQLIDQNFLSDPGPVRLALKVKGNALLLNSNVAPVIVRAEPIELEGGWGSELELDELPCVIKARVKFLSR